MKHKKITYTERVLLGNWKKEGVANKEIARRLGRPVLTIRRELKRNRTRVAVGKDWIIIYEPLHAQSVSDSRKQHVYAAKEPLKNKNIYSYVLKHLQAGWSPEQISGRLKEVDHKGEKDWQICMETIYQFIYKEKTDQTREGQRSEMDLRKKKAKLALTVTEKDRPLYEYLRRKQVRRHKKGGRKSHRVRIPDRVSIHDRPKAIDERSQFGHWEGDSIVGVGHTSGLHTEYERVSSMIRFEYMRRISTADATHAAQKIFHPLPIHAKRSTTLDNGVEHTNHKEFGIQTEPIYFLQISKDFWIYIEANDIAAGPGFEPE